MESKKFNSFDSSFLAVLVVLTYFIFSMLMGQTAYASESFRGDYALNSLKEENSNTSETYENADTKTNIEEKDNINVKTNSEDKNNNEVLVNSKKEDVSSEKTTSEYKITSNLNTNNKERVAENVKKESLVYIGKVKLQAEYSCVNFRVGPSVNSELIGSITNGTLVRVLETTNGWYSVECSGKFGYIKSEYVAIQSKENSATDDVDVPVLDKSEESSSGNATVENTNTSNSQNSTSNLNKTGKITLKSATSYVNVRAGSSTSTSTVGKLKHGDSVIILSKENNWYKVSSGSTIGFVRADFITVNSTSSSQSNNSGNSNSGSSNTENNNSDSSNSSSTENNIIATIKLGDSSGYVNVRTGSSTDTNIVGKLYHGNKVKILGNENGWYKISSGSTVGFVRGDFIDFGSNVYVSSDASLYKSTLKEGYVRYYAQDDSRYKNVMYSSHGDKSQTIEASACGPSAYSIVVSTLNGVDVPPTELCRYALAKGYRTYDNGTSADMFAAAANDACNTRYNLNYKYINNLDAVKGILSDGKHMVIASMLKGHVTKFGHYIVLSGYTTVNGTLYFKVYDPHSENEHYIFDKDLIDGTPNDGFILLSESAMRKEGLNFYAFSKKNS